MEEVVQPVADEAEIEVVERDGKKREKRGGWRKKMNLTNCNGIYLNRHISNGMDQIYPKKNAFFNRRTNLKTDLTVKNNKLISVSGN